MRIPIRRITTNPRFWMGFHAFGILRWLVLFPPGMILWRNNVPFLMYVIAGFGSALAARKADPEDPL